MEGVATAEVLQLTSIETSEGLTLKPAVAAEEEGSIGVKAAIRITSGSLVNSKINFVDISILNLSSCSLISIPQEFSALENLRVLNLSQNKLVEVPECLEKDLRFIEYLDLSCNSLTEFEREPACRVRLKVLLLNDNNLLNIPEWILYVRCFNLEEFDFSYNIVSRLYASQFDIKSNYRLKKLGLKSCCVYERHFKYINGIKTLECLDLSNHETKEGNINKFKGEKLFEQPSFSKSLAVLKLNYLTLSVLSDSIVCLVNLRELYLVGNSLSYLPDALTSFCNLEVLDVSENSICFLPADLYKLRNLKKLIVFSNIMTSLPDLSKMQQLYYIDLYKNYLSDFSFDINSFTHLDLEQNYVKTTELPQYEDYVKKRQNLRSVAKITYRVNAVNCVDESEQSSCSSDSTTSLIDESLEHYQIHQHTEEHVEELWDAPKDSNYTRVCTASDDEWTGELPPLVAMWEEMKRKSQDTIEQRVSPVFSDAD